MSANLTSPALDGMYPFLSEVAATRRRARRYIEARTIEANTSILPLLNEALATELVCVARYRAHAARLGESVAPTVLSEFIKYAQEEQGHADALAQRIRELRGEAVAEARTVNLNRDLYDEAYNGDGDHLADLLEEDLIAERIAIDSYREILQFVGDDDLTTRRLLESILAVELTHAQELSTIRAEVLRRERLSGATSSRLPRLELQ